MPETHADSHWLLLQSARTPAPTTRCRLPPTMEGWADLGPRIARLSQLLSFFGTGEIETATCSLRQLCVDNLPAARHPPCTESLARCFLWWTTRRVERPGLGDPRLDHETIPLGPLVSLPVTRPTNDTSTTHDAPHHFHHAMIPSSTDHVHVPTRLFPSRGHMVGTDRQPGPPPLSPRPCRSPAPESLIVIAVSDPRLSLPQTLDKRHSIVAGRRDFISSAVGVHVEVLNQLRHCLSSTRTTMTPWRSPCWPDLTLSPRPASCMELTPEPQAPCLSPHRNVIIPAV